MKRLFIDQALQESSVIKKYLITASDGKNYDTKHYNLQAIIAVGFKVENERAVQFRKWARQIVKDYTIQGWVMDVERLKNGSKLTDEFFEQQLEKNRLSERKFFIKKLQIFMRQLWITIQAPQPQNVFSLQFKTSYILLFTVVQQLKLLSIERIIKKRIWD